MNRKSKERQTMHYTEN